MFTATFRRQIVPYVCCSLVFSVFRAVHGGFLRCKSVLTRLLCRHVFQNLHVSVLFRFIMLGQMNTWLYIHIRGFSHIVHMLFVQLLVHKLRLQLIFIGITRWYCWWWWLWFVYIYTVPLLVISDKMPIIHWTQLGHVARCYRSLFSSRKRPYPSRRWSSIPTWRRRRRRRRSPSCWMRMEERE